MLPHNMTTTLFFTEDEIEELQESPLKGKIFYIWFCIYLT